MQAVKILVDEHIWDFDLQAALRDVSEQRREQALRFRHELGQRLSVLAYRLLKRCLSELYGMEGVRISAKNGEGFDSLLETIEKSLPVQKARVTLLFPFADIGQSSVVRENGAVLSEEYTGQGLKMDCIVDTVTAERLRKFHVDL